MKDLSNLNNKLKYIIESTILILLYGTVYFLIECIWKQSISDWRMFILGGFMGFLIGLQNNMFTYDIDFIYQMIVGSLMVTLCEAIFGYQWNTIEGLGIWDYSNTIIYGINGNVSLLFSLFAWTTLSGIVILLDDYIWHYIFGNGEKPYYIVFGKKLSY